MIKHNTIIPAVLVTIGLLFGLLINNANAQSIEYEIRETILIPDNLSGASVRHVGDMDGDGVLDILLMTWIGNDATIWIIERTDTGFVKRFNRAETNVRDCIVSDIDGDLIPEILLANYAYPDNGKVEIFEATGNNAYESISFTGRGKIESLKAGDSDGDGKKEFLIASEWIGVYIYETTGDNSYALEETLSGTNNGNVNLAGVYDLDGDGLPEVEFSGDPYDPNSRTVDVYENRTKIFTDYTIKLGCISVGDTDGDGLGEIIGNLLNANLAILESTGSDNQFQMAFDFPSTDYSASNIIDADEDGQAEFWCLIADSSGKIDAFALAHRDGDTIFNYYSSGALLQGFEGDIRHMLAINDTNADGGPELAVVQADNIHILEQVTNQPPSVSTDQSDVSVDEGQPASNTGSVSDPDEDTVTLSASVGTVTNNGDGFWSWSFAANDGPVESQTVTITADDGNGGIAEITFDLTVNNVAPAVGAVYVPIDPVLLGTPLYATADFTDPAGTNDDPYTCTVNYGDGGGDESGTVDGFTCVGPNHNYAGPGVYVVSVTVTDKDNGAGSAISSEYIVIYDPTGGFVTGGGWINSPAGAYTADSSLTGKANFGFVSKYKRGASTPTGETEFHFKVADLNFHSNTYDWLVIAGPKAIYKGTGTINESGNYGFMLSAIDEKLTPSTDVDLFRIKIWDKNNGDEIIYDNQVDDADDADPTTPIGGGSIVIHKP